jgi:cytochrome c-type biogenesis protein CcmE
LSPAQFFLALATGLIGFALKDGINLFRAPSQVLDDPPSPNEIFRLGGLVKQGSLIRGSLYTARREPFP